MSRHDTPGSPTVSLEFERPADGGPARPKRIARNLTPPASSGRGDSPLPDDLVIEQVRRLEVLALVSGGLWAVGLLMDAAIFPLALGREPNGKAIVLEVVAVATAVATYLWVRFSGRAPRAKSDAGLWLMLLNAADMALLETWANTRGPESLGQLSWICVVILVSAMIVPSTPRKMLAAALAAATMGPLGMWLAHLRGVEVPSVGFALLMYLPAYSCAVASVVPSRMFQRLGRRLREARDLGSYELEERLGEGGMGEVWRARHRLLARPAAIKLVRPEMLDGGSGADPQLTLRRFEAEARATAALTSPHTIRVFDFGATDEGRFYYAMELLEGRDMASLVEQHGPLPPARVVFLLRQVCHSLAEAHDQGLVHRDIKPANIFVCRMGLDLDVVKVLDFGLVQVMTRRPDDDLTTTLAALDGVVGTPAFMAPETLTGSAAVDHRADLYAVGCVAYYLLTGRQVFHGRTPVQALIDHVSTPPTPPSTHAAAPIPPWLDELVMACLAKDPTDRPQSATAILQRITLLESGPKWSSAQALDWWRAHLPDLMAPGVVGPGAMPAR